MPPGSGVVGVGVGVAAGSSPGSPSSGSSPGSPSSGVSSSSAVPHSIPVGISSQYSSQLIFTRQALYTVMEPSPCVPWGQDSLPPPQHVNSKGPVQCPGMPPGSGVVGVVGIGVGDSVGTGVGDSVGTGVGVDATGSLIRSSPAGSSAGSPSVGSSSSGVPHSIPVGSSSQYSSQLIFTRQALYTVMEPS